jgi:RNA polymerase sigma-70 factor (ECF subfamily)
LDSEKVRLVYEEYAEGLQRFLLGVLKDESAAADALQSTFIKLIEKGHSVQQKDSIKSWLFRVAFNEAMLIRRREAISRKHAEGVAWKLQLRLGTADADNRKLSHSVEHAIRQEDIALVRKALDQLSEPQREVVRKRIYEGLKFREIAEELDIPLGTVLARMQSSLKKLKPILAHKTEWHD